MKEELIPHDIINGFKLLMKHLKVNLDLKQRTYRLKVTGNEHTIKLSAWKQDKKGKYKEITPTELITNWMISKRLNKTNNRAIEY